MFQGHELPRRMVISGFISELLHVLASVPAQAVEQVVARLLETRDGQRRVYIIGNGGSASTASHLACDLTKTAQVAGFAPIRAFALTDNVPIFTAWANDSAYERTFAEQVASLVDAGDVVIGISASGNSPNVVKGLLAGIQRGASTIGLLGFDGGAAHQLVDIPVLVPSFDYGLVETAHVAICHAITSAIKQELERRSEHEPVAVTALA